MNSEYDRLYGKDGLWGAIAGIGTRPHRMERVASVMRHTATTGIADIRLGSSDLVCQAIASGLRAVGCDLVAEPGDQWLALDLGQPTAQHLDKIRCAFSEGAGEDYLLTFIGIGERLIRRDIAPCLFALNELACRFVYVEIDNLPSANHNLFHASILPLSSWLALFGAAGFEPVYLPPARHHPLATDPGTEVPPWVAEWRELDPLRDGGGRHTNRLLLRKVGSCRSAEAVAEAFAAISPLTACDPWLPAGIRTETLPPAAVFLVTCVQEFYVLMPLMAALGAARSVIILCDTPLQGLSETRRGIIRSFLLARGYAVLDQPGMDLAPQDLPWDQWRERGAIFCAVTESTSWAGHMVGMGFSAAAQAAGMESFVFQHGIMVEYAHMPLLYHSGCALTWSPGFETFLQAEARPGYPSMLRQGGLLEDTRVVVTGGPKFDLLDGRVTGDAAFMLGRWVTDYRRVVLLATNMHWGAHRADMPHFVDDIRAVCAADPDSLFILKPHPSDPVSAMMLPDGLPGNMVVVTDNLLLMMGLTVEWLVEVSDLVVSTLSTLLLEAALAARPAILLDSGNIHSYGGLQAVPAAAIAGRLDEHAVKGDALRAFGENYYDFSLRGRSTEAVLTAFRQGGVQRSPREIATVLAMATTIARYSRMAIDAAKT